MELENYKFHITYDDNMTLKELSELLANINISINDYYRENGVKNKSVSTYAPVVNKVENGSILMDIGVAVFSGLTATLLSEFIIERIRKLQNKKQANNENHQNIHITAGDNNTINIHIEE